MSNAVPDFRIACDLPDHRKTKRLIRLLGHKGFWCLMKLFAHARLRKPDGLLSGMDPADIADEAGWDSDPDRFVKVLLEVGFLDETKRGLRLHDWQSHNPYATKQISRSESARRAANARWDKRNAKTPAHDAKTPAHNAKPKKPVCATPAAPNKADATPKKPKGRQRVNAERCEPHKPPMRTDANRNAPPPPPVPTPNPTPEPEPIPKNGPDAESVRLLWNSICTRFSSLRKMDGARQQLVAIGSGDIDDYKSFFERIQASKFLRTNGGPGGWATFQWMINNRLNILEGKYDNRKPKPETKEPAHGPTGPTTI